VSKVEAQRALRDARYAAYYAKQAAAASDPPARRAAGQPPATPPAPDPQADTAADALTPMSTQAAQTPPVAVDGDPEPEPCGHRNIGNKTCRRPAGHPEKNHRYS
jgi:hypothetical protein